jgi:hypothetical protein
MKNVLSKSCNERTYMLVRMRRLLVKTNIQFVLFWAVFGGRSNVADFGSNLANSWPFGVKTAGKCMGGTITSRPESQASPLFRARIIYLDHFSGFFGRGAQFRDFFRFWDEFLE